MFELAQQPHPSRAGANLWQAAERVLYKLKVLEGNLQTRLFPSKVQAFLQTFYLDNPKQFQSAFNGLAGGFLSVSAALVDPHPVLHKLLVTNLLWKETII